MKKVFYLIATGGVLLLFLIAAVQLRSLFQEKEALKKVISIFQADSRIAQILVTNVEFKEEDSKVYTTIKFLEYDINQKPLIPRYFTFPGNIIQFQSLVIRFEDIYIQSQDKLKGRSAYFFWKVFMLDGQNTVEYELTKENEIPQGYKIESRVSSVVQERFWKKFWKLALDSDYAKNQGVKNVQIEAPGTMFIPGTLYTIKIEHDGGLRIDSQKIPEILKGEYIIN